MLSNDSSELILSIGVNLVMKFIIKHVSIKKSSKEIHIFLVQIYIGGGGGGGGGG